MSKFSGYKTKSFSESQKFFILDPNTGSPAFVPGRELIALAKNFVYSESTRDTAAATDYPVGAFIQTAGETSAGDNFGATYIVVPAGEGNFSMDNGNELLVIQGDEFLREELVQPVATYNSVAQMVADPQLTVSRKARTLGYYTPGDGGGNDYEIVAGATGTADGGSFIDLNNGLQAKGLFPLGKANALQYGAGAGVSSSADSRLRLIDADQSSGLDFGRKEVLSDSDLPLQNSPIPFSGSLLSDRVYIDHARGSIAGQRVIGQGSRPFTVADYGGDKLRLFAANHIDSEGWGLIVKPSNGDVAGAIAEGYLIALNRVESNSLLTKIAYSIDGDTNFTTLLGNAAYNIQREDGGTRDGYAFAIAGAAGDIPVNDCRGISVIANIGFDIRGAGLHVEDISPQTTGAFNTFSDVKRGIEIINDETPFMQNYIGNSIHAHTDSAIFSSGFGQSDSANFSHNLIDGADAVQTEYAARIHQIQTKNINFAHNIIANQDVGGLHVQTAKRFNVSHNVFKNITGVAILGSDVAVADDGVVIESNNFFENCTKIVDPNFAFNLVGDRSAVTKEYTGNFATGYEVLFVAQRPGIITSVRNIKTNNVTSGTVNGNLYYRINNSIEIDTLPIPLAEAELYKGIKYMAALTNHEFAAGDVITVFCDGNGDSAVEAVGSIEYFYYN